MYGAALGVKFWTFWAFDKTRISVWVCCISVSKWFFITQHTHTAHTHNIHTQHTYTHTHIQLTKNSLLRLYFTSPPSGVMIMWLVMYISFFSTFIRLDITLAKFDKPLYIQKTGIPFCRFTIKSPTSFQLISCDNYILKKKQKKKYLLYCAGTQIQLQ